MTDGRGLVTSHTLPGNSKQRQHKLTTVKELRRVSMAAAIITQYAGVLTILTITSVSSIYVRTGSDITDCSMKCPQEDGATHLYKLCGDDDILLLQLLCEDLWYENRFGPRMHLNTSSGCWTLTDAGKNDSCVYTAWYHNKSITDKRTSLPITVLDPVLISNITSNSSRLGQDITVRVQFSGEETAVTWEVDGQPLPDRYRLIDDNRTLLIPSAQRDDDQRRLCVRITNPVSEETREYQLEITDLGLSPRAIAALVAGIISLLLLVHPIVVLVKRHLKMKSKDEERNENTDPSEEHRSLNISPSEEHGPLTISSSEGHGPLTISSSEEHGPLTISSSEEHGPLAISSSEGHGPLTIISSESDRPKEEKKNLLQLDPHNMEETTEESRI